MHYWEILFHFGQSALHSSFDRFGFIMIEGTSLELRVIDQGGDEKQFSTKLENKVRILIR